MFVRRLALRVKRGDRFRQQVIDAMSGTCEYCTQRYDNGKNMVCHEVWEYDDHRHSATLTDFALACRDCNFALHPGAAREVGFRQEAKDQSLSEGIRQSNISAWYAVLLWTKPM